MSDSKRQHYVPQLLLRNFTNDDDWLFVFDKRVPEKGILKLRTKEALVESHRYTLYEFDESKNYSADRELTLVEDKASPIVEWIVESARVGKCPRLTKPEKHALNTFLCCQIFRSPDAYPSQAHIDQFFYDSVAKARKEDLVDEDVLSQLLDNRRFIDILEHNLLAESAISETVVTVSGISKHIRGKGLRIVTVEHSKSSFIVGSKSFARVILHGSLGPFEPEGYLWFPIAHDVVVTPFGRPNREEVSVAKTSFIRRLNKATYEQSTVIVGRSRDLVESLARVALRPVT